MLVLAVVFIVSTFAMPGSMMPGIAEEVVASALYVENWYLAVNAVDYLSRDSALSPVQHFWAMSIQGQFHILLPLLLLLALAIARKLRIVAVAGAAGLLALIFVASFAYANWGVRHHQEWTYFDTFARLWEFSLGSLAALLGRQFRPRDSIGDVISWLALGAIVGTGILLPVANVFPGYPALLPTLGAVLFLICARNSPANAGSLLSMRPLVWFGGISYGFYLWHWPLLVFFREVTDRAELGIATGLAVLSTAALLAFLTDRVFDRPFRARKAGLAARALLGAALLAMAVVPAATTWLVLQARIEASLANVADDRHPGAMSLLPENRNKATPAAELIPSPAAAKKDNPLSGRKKCRVGTRSPDPVECIFGVADENAPTVALVGGSLSAHWLPALELIAVEHGFRLVLHTKGACRFTRHTTNLDPDKENSCNEWNRRVLARLIEIKPDLVVTNGNVWKEPAIPPGNIDHWRELEAAGIHVLVFRETPRFPYRVPDCVSEHPRSFMRDCTASRSETLVSGDPFHGYDATGNVSFFDPNPYFCPGQDCPPAIGNVLIYRDSWHVTATYAETLAPVLAPVIVDLLGGIRRQDGAVAGKRGAPTN